jgi:hypothetical protein
MKGKVKNDAVLSRQNIFQEDSSENISQLQQS